MASRSRARQFAVQLIYQTDFTDRDLEEILPGFWEQQEGQDANHEFSERLAVGVLSHRVELDLELTSYLEKWTIERLISLNRIILEIALYELKFMDETPWKVVVDEAVTLAKGFSGEEHVGFVNGVLHRWCTKNRDQ